MTTAKRTTRRQDDDEREDEGGAAAVDDLDSVVEELTGEAEHVVLWRLDGPTGKQEHVDKVQLSRFNAEYVVERHGGGDYLMRAYGPKQKGGRRDFKKYKEFSIDKSIPPKSGSAAVEWQKRNPAAASGNGQQQQQQHREPSPWVGIALATVPALATGLLTVLTREKQTDPILLKLLENVGGKRGDDINPVELQKLLADERERGFQNGKELGELKGAASSGGSGDDGAAIIRETLPPLMDFFKQSVENDRERTRVLREQGTTAKVKRPAATLAAGTASDAGPEWMKSLRKYSKQLLALMGSIDAVTLAGKIIDELPVKMVRELSAACELETFVSDTLAEFPEFSTTPERREYFTALLTAVQSACTSGGEDDEDDDEEEEGAHSGDGDQTQGGDDGEK